jgi:hypothetical protein
MKSLLLLPTVPCFFTTEPTSLPDVFFHGKEYEESMARKSSKTLHVMCLAAVAIFASSLLAYGQVAPYSPPDDNLGSWSWDRRSTKKSEEDTEERETGETSWERMQAERQNEELEQQNEDAPKSLSPLEMWNLLRGRKDH